MCVRIHYINHVSSTGLFCYIATQLVYLHIYVACIKCYLDLQSFIGYL